MVATGQLVASSSAQIESFPDDADSRSGSATSLLRTITAAICVAAVAGSPSRP